MRNTLIPLLVAAAAVAATPGRSPGGPADIADLVKPDQAPPDWARIVAGNNRFAVNLYERLAKEDGNLFFSPGSIHTALTMAYAGARANTEKQMRDVLALPADVLLITGGRDLDGGPAISGEQITPWPQLRVHRGYTDLIGRLKPGKDAGYQLHVANALWGQKGYRWLPEFLKTTRDHYGAGLREVDFVRKTEAARKTINGWVEDQTKEKVKELLKRGILKPATVLVLTNAIYFKGDWASQFKKDRTREDPFHLSADKTAKVPLMHQTGKFGYAETKDLQVLRLPYKGKDLSMLVLLPRKVGDFKAAEAYLKTKIAAKGAKLKMPERKVIVSLPKFKLTAEFKLNEALKAMGMTDAFSNADFSGMNGKGGLFISAVVHKAFVDVNEEGTEAAAATAVVMSRTSAAAMPPVFRADRPFLFAIRHDKTGAILFLGRLTSPAK